jgi:hypothetical protein
MSYRLLRVTLLVLTGFVGLTAVGGGAAILSGLINMPLAWLQNTPFSSYILPGLVLTIIVGGSAVVAAVTTLVDHEMEVLTSLVAGVILVAWIGAEIAMLGLTNWLQPFYLAIGLIIIVLAACLGALELRHGA